MKIWAVANQKGGVGKTTSVVTLGGILASWGFRTLLIDLDPHGSLTSYFKLNPDDIQYSAYNLFQDASQKQTSDPRCYIQGTEFDGLAVLPASTALATLERQAALSGGMGLVIARNLETLEDHYDFALIDSPPMLGVLMVNALAACEHLLVPVLAEFLALNGLERMLRTLQMIKHSRKTQINYTILTTLFDKRTRASVECQQLLRQRYADRLAENVIPVDTKLRDASQVNTPPSLYAPHARAVVAYTRLLEALLRGNHEPSP